MANANAPLEFTGGETELVNRLSVVMKVVTGVLLILGVVSLIGGAASLLTGSPTGILAILEGLVTGLLGLILLAASADVRFMVQTKFASIHLANAFQNLAMFYKVQFFLALALIGVV